MRPVRNYSMNNEQLISVRYRGGILSDIILNVPFWGKDLVYSCFPIGRSQSLFHVDESRDP